MPSYTFVSTANAFVLRGARIKFVDIRPDTLNLDERLVEAAITGQTKAVVPVHYAGVGCDMDAIMEIARRRNLLVIEDAAQGVNATYKGRYLGTIGHLGAYSFHETKNFISGEGGAIVINDEGFIERAEIIREKGTNRSKFFRGQVDKYTWVDIGSSYLPSEITAAFLFAQLEEADAITRKRWAIYEYYQEAFARFEERGWLQRPRVPPECRHNAHMFYIILPTEDLRDRLINHLRDRDILAVFHYVPLHTSPMGVRMGHRAGDLPVTEDLSSRLLRLPCYFELEVSDQERIVTAVEEFFRKL
jgi:dTDP-4-amino-4,6-dideoxygalactose transaminase